MFVGLLVVLGTFATRPIQVTTSSGYLSTAFDSYTVHASLCAPHVMNHDELLRGGAGEEIS